MTCRGDVCSEVRAQLVAFAEELQHSRPNMAPVYNLIQRWVDEVEALPGDDLPALRREAAEAAEALCDASMRAVDQAAANALPLIGDDAVIISLSFSSTVMATLRQVRSERVEVILGESRPGMEGREQARAIANMGFRVTFITDAQLGLFSGRATIALVGADAVLADGSVVNKAGTYLLALAARDRGIPFCSCFESFKYAPFHARSFELEELPVADIEPPKHPQIEAKNVLFDITPARLVDHWITEAGIRSDPH